MWARIRRGSAAGAVVLVAAGLRFHDLGHHSLWLDEVTTAQEISSWRTAAASGFHPPLYFVLLRVWSLVLGTSPAVLRGLSALFGTAAVWLTMRVARTVFGRRDLAIAAGVLVAVAPHALWFSREMRMYAVWTFFALVLAHGAVNLGRRAGWAVAAVLYVGGAIAGQLTHHYHLFYVAGAAVGSAIVLRHHLTRWLRIHALLLAAAVSGAVAFALVRGDGPAELLRYVAGRATAGGSGPSWSTFSQIVLFENWAYRMGSDHRLAGMAVAATLAVALFSCFGGPGTARRRAVLVVVTVVPIAAILFLPIRDYARLLAPTVPLVAIVYARALMSPVVHFGQRGWLAVVPAAVAIAVVGRPYASGVYEHEIEAWNTVCERVASNEEGRDVVLVTARYVTKAIDYCYDGPAPIRGFPASDAPLTADAVFALADGFHHVWMIYSHAFDPKDADVRRDAVAVLRTRYALVGAWRVGPLIEVYELRLPEAQR